MMNYVHYYSEFTIFVSFIKYLVMLNFFFLKGSEGHKRGVSHLLCKKIENTNIFYLEYEGLN